MHAWGNKGAVHLLPGARVQRIPRSMSVCMPSAVHHLAGHWEPLYYQKSYAGLQEAEADLGQVALAIAWFQVKQTRTSFHDIFLLI